MAPGPLNCEDIWQLLEPVSFQVVAVQAAALTLWIANWWGSKLSWVCPGGKGPPSQAQGTQKVHCICTAIFIAAWFTIAKRWKQPKCPPMNEWMGKQNVVYTYSGVLFSLKYGGYSDRMKIQDALLTDKWSQKENTIWFHLYKFPRRVKFIETEKASLVAQMVKNLPAMPETWVWSLGREDVLEKGMATYSSILTWEIPQTEEFGRLQPMGSQRVGHNWVTNTYTRREREKIE